MQSTTATPFAATRLSLRIHKDPPEPEKDKIRKSFFFKTVFQKMNRQGTYLENIFTMHISDQTLISRTYKELLLLNNRQIVQLNVAKNLECSQERINKL